MLVEALIIRLMKSIKMSKLAEYRSQFAEFGCGAIINALLQRSQIYERFFFNLWLMKTNEQAGSSDGNIQNIKGLANVLPVFNK